MDRSLGEFEEDLRDAVFSPLDESALEGEGVLVEDRQRFFGDGFHLLEQSDPLADDTFCSQMRPPSISLSMSS